MVCSTLQLSLYENRLKKDIQIAMERMLSANGPYVVECVVPHEDCYPWIKPGSGFPEIMSGGK